MASELDLPGKLKGLNLYLIGMMGAGKSTVGQLLATQLGYHFFDTDTVIEQAAGRSISEIFATAGEAGFRDLETQVLAELSTYKNLVIATGGGIVLKQMNWSYLRHGLIIWLDVPAAQLYNRLKGDATRPLLQVPDPKQHLQMLLEKRRSLYAQADIQLTDDTNASPEQITLRILEKIPTVLKPELPLPPPIEGQLN